MASDVYNEAKKQQNLFNQSHMQGPYHTTSYLCLWGWRHTHTYIHTEVIRIKKPGMHRSVGQYLELHDIKKMKMIRYSF